MNQGLVLSSKMLHPASGALRRQQEWKIKLLNRLNQGQAFMNNNSYPWEIHLRLMIPWEKLLIIIFRTYTRSSIWRIRVMKTKRLITWLKRWNKNKKLVQDSTMTLWIRLALKGNLNPRYFNFLDQIRTDLRILIWITSTGM